MIDPNFKESVGMLDAKKLTAGGWTQDQRVTLTLDAPYVRLTLSTSDWPAGLTPEQARFLARNLNRYARILEGK